MHRPLKMLDLFSGIGGFSLAAHWTGQIETVAFCEIEPFAQKVLRKNFPGVPIFEDVRTLNGGEIEPVDIICGGYPCQPFSYAGERRGEEDDRHLWPEVYRLLQELRPDWLVCENVAGHVTMGLDSVLSDLEAAGYTGTALIVPACAVGARHRRGRVWIVAHAERDSVQGWPVDRQERETKAGKKQLAGLLQPCAWPSVSTARACRNDDGIPNRVHRNKALGNTIVPQVAYEIFSAMLAANREWVAS